MICAFLLKCGYPNITGELQEKIIMCLVYHQFIIKIRDGDIKYFACWFRIEPEDKELIEQYILPEEVQRGSLVYICDLGNTEGTRGMYEMIKTIRKKTVGAKGVFWHRPSKDNKLFYFPSQRGGLNGN
jgi:hypothetical protein